MIKKTNEGQIVTFYSFKGGVGRTMALANVAFLAALNGQRVLVMDWDLEAPGLAYYFRGLLEAPDAKDLKDAPGVLDILWDWSCSIKEDQSKAEIEVLLKRFKEGVPFQACVRPLLEPERLPPGATLDFLGAGSRSILTPEPRIYEEALARFSWSSFFEEEAGGHALLSLRLWAKSKYDIVLVDSRTGLADVAGICTMQIPDLVLLCFVLNRQNIDGIAKVAAAIRANREEAVAIRAAPMRVARQDTSEESDARARAIWELKRVGGFSSEAIQKDFSTLQVPATDNVPFYETLAPFTAPNPIDPLTFSYLRLATELLGKPIVIPSLDVEWIELVRRRLQPRHATVEYIAKLKSADPTRVVTELQRLIESALDAEMDGGELDEDYVAALVEAVIGLEMADMADSPVDGEELQSRTLDLLRILAAEQPNKWQASLTLAIERYLGLFSFNLETEEELALLDELDSLLAQLPTLVTRLKRIGYRRSAARLFVEERNAEAAMQTVGEILTLIQEATRENVNLASEHMDEIIAAEADISLLTGDVNRMQEEFKRAYKEYQKGLKRLAHIEPGASRTELSHLRFELHSRLAEAPSPFVPELMAADHAIQAVKWGGGFFSMLTRFIRFAEPVLSLPEHPDIALAFCESALGAQDGRVQAQFAHYFGRQLNLATNFLTTAVELSRIIVQIGDERAKSALLLLAETSKLVLRNLNRRRQTIGGKYRDEISSKIIELMNVLKNYGLPAENISDLEEALAVLGTRRLRANQPPPVER